MTMFAQASQRVLRNDQIRLFVLALLVGALAGYGALLFRLVARGIQVLALGHAGSLLVSHAETLPWWHLLLAPGLGGLVIGLFVVRFMPGQRPQGVADVMEASALRNGRMSLRTAIGAAATSAASIGCGASVGREGPIVHLGAGLGSTVARWLHLSPSLTQTLLGCGVAAAIGSTFNAPIAGVFFALEVVIGHYGMSTFSPVVVSSIIGTMITRIHIGPAAAFQLPPQVVNSFWELPAFALLGLLSALVAVLLIRSIALVAQTHERLQVPIWCRPMLAGLLVGAIAIWFPEVLGVGYEATDRTLRNAYDLHLLIVLAMAKAVATALCLGSSFGGGIFSPSLVIGALLGGAFGMVATALVPDVGSSPSVYAILGMGAVAACTLGAPVSTVIMVFELTTDYGITFAIMGTVAVAAITCRQIEPNSFFTWQLQKRGVDLRTRRDRALLRTAQVVQVMRQDVVTVGLAASLDDLKAEFVQRHLPIFVVDGDNRLVGSIHFEDLADAAFADDGKRAICARDLVHRIPTALSPEDDLETALRLAEINDEEHLPVVSDGSSLQVIGEVRRSDLVLAYNRALLEARERERA